VLWRFIVASRMWNGSFVAGMLHDVGQVVLSAARPEVIRELLEAQRDTGRLYLDLERERLGFDHAELGGRC